MSILDLLTSNASSAVSRLSSTAKNLTGNKSAAVADTFNTTGGGTGYEVGNMQYPDSLSVDDDMQHWITFYINVRGKSKIAQDKTKLASDQPISIKGENRLDPTQMDQAVITSIGAGGAVSGLGIGAKLGKTLGNAAFAKAKAGGSSTLGAATRGFATIGAAAAAGAATGAVLGGAAASLVVKSDTTYRLKDCISLHVSQAPNTHSNADYDIVEVGALGGLGAGGSSALSETIGASQNQEALLAAMRKVMQAPAGLITSGNGKALIDAATKQTLNPYREVLFRSVGFRRFAFDYRFYPKSAAETQMIQKIIQTFKYHMHPELSAGGLYYIHPSEFNIQYYFKGKENPYFNKISTCALVDMDVTYGDRDNFSTFADGAPTEITMSLHFQELETLTNQRVLDGY